MRHASEPYSASVWSVGALCVRQCVGECVRFGLSEALSSWHVLRVSPFTPLCLYAATEGKKGGHREKVATEKRWQQRGRVGQMTYSRDRGDDLGSRD